jgi:hypothetical protein
MGRRIRRNLAMMLLSLSLPLGAGCSGPPVVSPYNPIPPPDPTFGPPTPELDSSGISHIYWNVTSPHAAQLSNTWIYVDNSNLGIGVSLRAQADGSYFTRIEGREGDRILFGFGAAYSDAEVRKCRPLREGEAKTGCQ